MKEKTWIANFKFPQLSASHYWQSVQVDAPTLEIAFKKAWREVKKRPAVKGKRLKQITVTFEVDQE